MLADIHNAVLCCVVANSIGALRATMVQLHTRKKQRAKTYKPKDFMVFGKAGKRKKKTGSQMLAMVELLNTALGGKDLRKKNGDPKPG